MHFGNVSTVKTQRSFAGFSLYATFTHNYAHVAWSLVS